jgi:UDP:flavonoid glycosyltransferase YjiC (YdhE family)
LPARAAQATLPEWWDALDRGKQLILVTQGTIANRDLGQLIGPTLNGLAEEEDLIVLATTGGQPIASIPGEIPANARVAEFLPFEQVLPHIDLLITNGGYGTVNMALAEGIPIVAAGLTEDKEEVSAHVQWAGVGIDLRTNQADPEMVRRAVREVLDNPSYRIRAKKMAREFASCNPEKSLLNLIESCVSETVGG